MIAAIHPFSNIELAKNQDEFHTLHAFVTLTQDNIPCIETIWEPTPKELEMLKNGGFVRLTTLGTQFPPVILDTVERIHDA